MSRNGHKQIKSIRDLQPDVLNANKGTPRGLQMVEDSLRTYGAGRSILADKNGKIIAGNKTLQSASDIDLPVRVVETDGRELVVVQRTDLGLNSKKARELGIADNRSSQVGLEWDADVLAQLKDEGVELSGMFTEKELITRDFRAVFVRFDNQTERQSPRYPKWRRQVFQRDDYTCQGCGAKGQLNAHHVKGCEFPELRFDVDNGLSLCFDCHSDIHPHMKLWKRKTGDRLN